MESFDQSQTSDSGLSIGYSAEDEQKEKDGDQREEISADVDNLMDRVAELERLTTEALQVLPERDPSAMAMDTSAFSVGLSEIGRDTGTADEPQPSRISVEGDKDANHALTDASKECSRSAGPVVNFDSPSRQSTGESTIVFEGLEVALKNLERGNQTAENPKCLGSECGAAVPSDDVLVDFRKRIGNIEKEMTGWSSRLEERENRIRSDVMVQLEQLVQETVNTRAQSLEREVRGKFALLQAAGSDGLVSTKGQKGASKSSTSSSNPRRSPAPAQRQSGGKGSVRLSPGGPQKQTGEGNAAADSRAADAKAAEPAKSLKSPASKIAEAFRPTAQEAAEGKKERFDEFGSFKSALLMDVDGIRQEVFAMEQRVKLYVRDFYEAEMLARQDHREMEKDAKGDGVAARKNWSFAPPQDGFSVGSTAFEGTRTSDHGDSFAVNSDAPAESKVGRTGESELSLQSPNLSVQSPNQSKRVVDMQLGSIATRCVSLTETLSSCSNLADEQVGKHLMQLSNDLEKVVTYLSGALQLQLESKAEVISLLQRQSEHITKVLLPCPSPSGVSTVFSTPVIRSATPLRGPLLPQVTRMLSAEEIFTAGSEHAIKYPSTTPPPPGHPSISPASQPRTSPFADEETLMNAALTLAAGTRIAPPTHHERSPSGPRARQVSRSPSTTPTPSQTLPKRMLSVPASVSLPVRGRSYSPTSGAPLRVSHIRRPSLRSTWSPTSPTRQPASHSMHVPIIIPSRSSGVTVQPSAAQPVSRSAGTQRAITGSASNDTKSVTGSIVTLQPSAPSSFAMVSPSAASTCQEASSQTGASLKATAWQTPNTPLTSTWPSAAGASVDLPAATGAVSVSSPLRLHPSGANLATESVSLSGASSSPVPRSTPSFTNPVQGNGASLIAPQEKVHRPRSRLSVVESRLDAQEVTKGA